MVSSETGPTSSPPLRVLLVDDEADLRTVLRHLLRRHGGFEVVGEAVDGDDAVAAAGELQPDVVVLDLLMPQRGDDALPHLLSVAPRAMVAVVTALSAVDHRERLLSAGAFSFHEKSRIRELPQLLAEDHADFRRALEGDDVSVRWAQAHTEA